ncbi:hypothetical protein GDO81_015341 [Engystomops pustulosus]|uniref:Ubiquitin-like domain-containing protein n=1 Tax=Engystomops pustulosus TaxID=76066 RepID=A0AAV7ATK3_ENGPU|nr:hypothetical protein GDO81_015341 [Engystomops pustulosus]KAG8561419.1 hypothetical protein GDO81_015341 [Engystomops pustulosus]
MQIFLKGQDLHTLDVSDQDTVLDVKNRIAQLEGLLDCDLVLSYAGISLEDEAELSECGVQDQCTLNVTSRLLGGMIFCMSWDGYGVFQDHFIYPPIRISV